MKQLRFGSGRISISTFEERVDGELEFGIALEEGLGTGEMGGKVPEREEGTEVEEWAEDAVVMVFANVESVDVLIEALQQVRGDLEEATPL